MGIDKIVTLKNGKKYLILLESTLTLDGYFLAEILNDAEETTRKYAVLQEIEKENRHFIKTIDDDNILNELLKDYYSQKR